MYKPFSDYERLKRALRENYGLSIDNIELMSDFCASVYLLFAADNQYVFKLYRTFDTSIALQSANITDYLVKQSFPVATIVCTKSGQSAINMVFPEGDRIGILFDFIHGTMGYDLPFESYAVEMGETISRLHSIMDHYNKPIIQYGKAHYAGRYINVMKEFDYSPSKIEALEAFADMLWNNVAKTKPGFCHGDLNASNFIVTPDGKCCIFDFDCAGIAYPINDIWTICTVTETFFEFNTTKHVDPAAEFLLLRQGYEKYRTLNDYDVSAMYSFIGLSCYWAAAQNYKYRPALEGWQWLNKDYFDNNYTWLMHWKNICESKGLL